MNISHNKRLRDRHLIKVPLRIQIQDVNYNFEASIFEDIISDLYIIHSRLLIVLILWYFEPFRQLEQKTRNSIEEENENDSESETEEEEAMAIRASEMASRTSTDILDAQAVEVTYYYIYG